MHELSIAHVELRPKHSIDEMLLHRGSIILGGAGLNVRYRPNLLLSINQVLNCASDQSYFLIVHLILTIALGQHLWVALVLHYEGLSQSLGDPELRGHLRHIRLVSLPKAADGEQISHP